MAETKTELTETVEFPCRRMPADPAVGRLIGLYPQRQEGLWMQRVKVLGGILDGRQWAALGRIARQFAGGTPLHLTTRQDVEVHDLSAEAVPDVQASLAEAGLTTVGACGDTLRNLTVCPCSGVAPGRVDLVPLAWQIRRQVEAIDGILHLPRKFKISLSCGEGCGQPWINDLGLIAARNGELWGFRVIVAGSLGARPGTGMLLTEWMPAADVLPLVTAAVGVFAEHGDRQNRRKARLRHIRERMGDEAFAELLLAAFEAAKAAGDWPAVELTPAADGFGASVALAFANGDITPDAADALGRLADDAACRVRIANHHRLIVFGPDEDTLRGKLAELPAFPAGRPRAAVVACPGKRWCSRGLVHTNDLADRIGREILDQLPPEMTVCISGCPNDCAHSAVADVGLSGAMSQGAEAFNLSVGGRMGRDAALAERIGSKLSGDQVIKEIEKWLRTNRNRPRP